MENRKELINPHDKITLDCSNVQAAQMAVLILGNGAYGIEDDVLPLLLFGTAEKWCQEKYGKCLEEWMESIELADIATVFESMRLEHERSSISDPVGHAHEYAAAIRKKLAKAPTPAGE